MIVTHTANAKGHRRIYLGGKSSVECWIEPEADGVAWTFHIIMAPAAFPLPDVQLRTWAIYTLLRLADELAVAPADLKAVPFECIAALHTSNPADYQRAAVPRRQSFENAFVASAPSITRPDTFADTINETSSRRQH